MYCLDCLSICSMSRLFLLPENSVNVLLRLSFNMFHVKVISFVRKYCKCNVYVFFVKVISFDGKYCKCIA